MNCAYCGIAAQSGVASCPGCGAHGTAATATPELTLYEQIGRAVVHREHGNALQALARIGEREEASERETNITRIAKVLACLFILWHFPALLLVALSFGMMFFVWIYLPYRGLKAVMGWLSS